jgi:ActR/RegA family two-component response regulator
MKKAVSKSNELPVIEPTESNSAIKALSPADFAHDINNLLLIIQNTVSTAWRRRITSKTEREALDTISLAVKKASVLANDMMDGTTVCRIFSGIPVAPDDVIEYLKPLIYGLVSDKTKLTFKVADKLRNIKIDLDHFSEVMINIVKNADEAIGKKENGIIEISVFNEKIEVNKQAKFAARGCNPKPGEGVVFSVKDNGRGVSGQVLENLLKTSFTTKIDGHGVGLSNIRSRVDLAGGGIHLDSVEGESFTIQIWLPATKEAPTPILDSKKSSDKYLKLKSIGVNGKRKPLAFMCDDDGAILQSSALLFESMNVDFLMSDSIEESENLFDEHQNEIDIVSLDAHINETSTEKFLGQLVEKKPEIPIILISGYSEAKVRTIFPKNSYLKFLPKPFSRSDIWEIISEFVSRSKDSER